MKDLALGGTQGTPTSTDLARRSIALLGLREASGREACRWAALALTELIGRELATGKIRVITGRETARMQGPTLSSGPLSVVELARVRSSTGADLVLSGTARLHEDMGLGVTLYVQDARTGELVGNVLVVGPEEPQDVAEAAVTALRRQLASEPLEADATSRVPSPLRGPSGSMPRFRVIRTGR